MNSSLPRIPGRLRPRPALLAPALLLGVIPPAPAVATPAVDRGKVYDLSWTIAVDTIPEGSAKAVVWIALPQERPEQQVSAVKVVTDHPWTTVVDPDFGNRMVRVTVTNPPASFTVTLGAQVAREPVDGPRPATLDAKARALYLRPEALVSLSPRVRALADSVGKDDRARYGYVMAHMTYDKTAPGWGHGDTERACDVGKGNCTDYHSLFMSLSRAENVPCVFEMGYPTVAAGETASVGGYHCWTWFYRNRAWVPVDISEADKHPEKTDFFFGHLDADRITFSRGRDVRLPGMQGPPLNYLPSGAYAEVDGKPFDGVTRAITYSVREAGETARHE
jgi:Transglutaminase-like superfamily